MLKETFGPEAMSLQSFNRKQSQVLQLVLYHKDLLCWIRYQRWINPFSPHQIEDKTPHFQQETNLV